MLLDKSAFSNYANKILRRQEQGKVTVEPIIKQEIHPDLKKRIKRLRNDARRNNS